MDYMHIESAAWQRRVEALAAAERHRQLRQLRRRRDRPGNPLRLGLALRLRRWADLLDPRYGSSTSACTGQ